jgi:hypothetical protein
MNNSEEPKFKEIPVPIYARDLNSDLLTDVFMGEGFEEALEKAKKLDKDLVVGTYLKKGKWRME